MPQTNPRYLILDLARSLALLAMVIFHLTWDLTMFGWLPGDTPGNGWFWYHARLTAGSFIFLAGVGLWLAHGKGFQARAFWKRFAKIAAAAGLVSLGSYFAMPGQMIFFGILHSIALSSLLGLLALRLPVWAISALAAAVFTLPWYYNSPLFGGWLIWTGLAPYQPITADFEPIFPWFAPFLAGIAFGKLMQRWNLWEKITLPNWPILRALAWPGRHSLLIYLIHQPILIALVAAGSLALR